MKIQKAVLCILIVSLLVSMTIPMAYAKKPPKPPGGEDPPADPAIAFYQSGRRSDKLMVMNDDGSNQVAIYEGSFNPWGPFSWSPYGGSITWGSYSGGYVFSIWRIDVTVVDGQPQGSNLRQLVSDDGSYLTSAAWSPLGNEIVFVEGDMTSNNWWIKSVPAVGGTPEIIYAGNEIGINIRSLTWNSAGTHIAFIEADISTGERYIRIIERATGDVTNTMLWGQYQLFRIDWARGGVDTIVFDDEVTETIYTVEIGTGNVESVTAGMQPCWSSDNSHVAFKTTGRKPSISKIEVGTGDITKLANGVNQGWRRF